VRIGGAKEKERRDEKKTGINGNIPLDEES